MVSFLSFVIPIYFMLNCVCICDMKVEVKLCRGTKGTNGWGRDMC